MAYDDNGQWQEDPPGGSAPLKPGDPGYRQAPWAPGYNPGPDWNNGVAPGAPSPRYDYNGGSAPNDPNDPLQAGNTWEWQGPQQAQWNGGTNQWDRGVWNQKAPAATTGGPPGGGAPGAVASVPASASQPGVGITVPPAQLPGDIAGLFSQVPQKTPVQSAYQEALLRYLGKSQETPSLTDSTLAPQVEVFRAAQQRGQERSRLKASERAAATGQSESGYLDNLINQGVQEQGFNTSAFNANLLGGEMTKRRDELQMALRMASQTGDAEATRELQTRLADVNARMQQQGLNLQGQLGGGDLALRLMQTMFGQDNFYDQLGTQTALSLEGLNQSALSRILGVT